MSCATGLAVANDLYLEVNNRKPNSRTASGIKLPHGVIVRAPGPLADALSTGRARAGHENSRKYVARLAGYRLAAPA